MGTTRLLHNCRDEIRYCQDTSILMMSVRLEFARRSVIAVVGGPLVGFKEVCITLNNRERRMER